MSQKLPELLHSDPVNCSQGHGRRVEGGDKAALQPTGKTQPGAEAGKWALK